MNKWIEYVKGSHPVIEGESDSFLVHYESENGINYIEPAVYLAYEDIFCVWMDGTPIKNVEHYMHFPDPPKKQYGVFVYDEGDHEETLERAFNTQAEAQAYKMGLHAYGFKTNRVFFIKRLL